MNNATNMTRNDQKILFTALAFLAVVMKNENPEHKDEAGRVMQLAGLIESFCAEHLGGESTSLMVSTPTDTDAASIDRRIDQHIRELKEEEITRLPEDRQGLLKLYDRLLQRKTWRMHRKIYASVNEDRLADLVLRLMDEEINDDGNKALA